MIDNIQFNDSGKKINITIDKESVSIPIYDIVKLNTLIDLNKSLNTPLNENINIDATLYSYNIENVENEIDFDNLSIADFDDTVNITIYNANDTIYHSNDVQFKEGRINYTIKNKLPIGTYKASISFAGNKYLKPSNLDIYFEIEKKLATFIFDEKVYYGYPKENIDITGILQDSLTNKPISNCIIQYTIDSDSYATISDTSGNVYFSVKVPEANKNHCLRTNINENDIEISEIGAPYENEYEDANEVIEEDDIEIPNENISYNESFNVQYENKDINNVVYSLIIDINNDSYNINDNSKVNVVVKKIPTHISIHQKESSNNIISLGGNIIGENNNIDENVSYGNATLSFKGTSYVSSPIIIEDGSFDIDIDIDNIIDEYNISDIESPIIYEKTLDQSTVTEIEIENDSINVGERIIATSKVKTATLSEYIQGGMIVFVLTKDNKEVYRYGTQTDNIGRATFYFNTSRSGTYEIYAYYCGLFGFLDSESSTKIIEVLE